MEDRLDVPTYVLEYALSMIDWRAPVRFRLVMYVHANRQRDARLTVLSLANTCEETGISPTIAHRQYGELVDAGVLERFDGGGPRGHAYRVSARFDLWQVPWLGERAPAPNESPSREWLLKRNVALAQIDRLLRPPVESNDGTVARPGARLTATAARTYARLSSASRAAMTARHNYPLIQNLPYSLTRGGARDFIDCSRRSTPARHPLERLGDSATRSSRWRATPTTSTSWSR